MKKIIIIGVLIIASSIGFQYGMAYADKSTISSIISGLDKKSGLSKLPAEEISAMVLEQVAKNGVDYLTADDLSIHVSQTTNSVKIGLQYIKEIDLFGLHQFQVPMEAPTVKLSD